MMATCASWRPTATNGASSLRSGMPDHIGEHTEPWSYMKFCYLKAFGWQGFQEGSGQRHLLCGAAGPPQCSRRDGDTTSPGSLPASIFGTLGGRPVHHTLANHWARVIELLYAAERMQELAHDPELTDPAVRAIPTAVPREGIGVVEAPRGTLFHHYQTDERGLITKANLIVATQNNAARISMSVEKAARGLITASTVDEGVLNMVEMAFRAYDPCLGCATHSLPGSMPLSLRVCDRDGMVLSTLRRDADGSVHRTNGGE